MSTLMSFLGSVLLLLLSIVSEEVHHVSRDAIAVALMIYLTGHAILYKE